MGMSKAEGDVMYAAEINNLTESVEKNGVLTGLSVAENGTPDMSVNVAAGNGFTGGNYINKASTTNIAIAAADPTNPRIDLIVMNSAGTISAVTGTPAATPNPPALPAGSIMFAFVAVAATVTQIFNANITDKRMLIGSILEEMLGDAEITDAKINTGSWSYANKTIAQTITGAWDFSGILDMKTTLRISAANKISFCNSGETEVGSLEADSSDRISIKSAAFNVGSGLELRFGDGTFACANLRANAQYMQIRNDDDYVIFGFHRQGNDQTVIRSKSAQKIKLETYNATAVLVEVQTAALGGGVYPEAHEEGQVGTPVTLSWGAMAAQSMYDDDGNLGSYSERADLEDLMNIQELKHPKTGEKVRGSWGDPIFDAGTIPHYIRSRKTYEKHKENIREFDPQKGLPVLKEIKEVHRPKRGYFNNAKWKGWMISLHQQHVLARRQLKDEYEAKIQHLLERIEALEKDKVN